MRVYVAIMLKREKLVDRPALHYFTSYTIDEMFVI